MKPMTATVMAAFLTGSLAFSAVAPTFAQEASPTPAAPPAAETPAKPDRGNWRPGPRGGDHMNRSFGGLEQMLERLAERITLTAEQTTLLENLKSASTAAGTEFKAVIDDLRPTPPAPPTPPTPSPEGANPPPAPPAPDFVERFEANLALSKANVAAMEAIKPAYDAFFSSLTDEQKAQLSERGDHRDRGDRGDRRERGDRGDHRPDPRANHDPAKHDSTDSDHSQHEGAADEQD